MALATEVNGATAWAASRFAERLIATSFAVRWPSPLMHRAVFMASDQHFQLYVHFLTREIRSRYLGSLSGLAWTLLHPVALLALYATVFVQIFAARIPEAGEHGFVAYVAVGFWAWTMFAEGLGRASTAIQDHAGLIGKVALPTEILVLASVSASFCVHLLGYVVVLILLRVFGVDWHFSGLPVTILALITLFMLTLGLSFWAAASQVFVRDLSQILGQLLAFGFFLTPILYSRSMLPEFARDWMDLNPLGYYPERLREALLSGHWQPQWSDLKASLIAAGVLLFGLWYFRRLRRHFEDFL